MSRPRGGKVLKTRGPYLLKTDIAAYSMPTATHPRENHKILLGHKSVDETACDESGIEQDTRPSWYPQPHVSAGKDVRRGGQAAGREADERAVCDHPRASCHDVLQKTQSTSRPMRAEAGGRQGSMRESGGRVTAQASGWRSTVPVTVAARGLMICARPPLTKALQASGSRADRSSAGSDGRAALLDEQNCLPRALIVVRGLLSRTGLLGGRRHAVLDAHIPKNFQRRTQPFRLPDLLRPGQTSSRSLPLCLT